MKCVASVVLVGFALWGRAISAAPVCVLGMVPCFLFCGSPPYLADADQAALWLRPAQYESVNRLAQVSALVLTQAGKCMGINGWKRYRMDVWAVGTVSQVATSWDGLCTVDVVLTNFNDSNLYQLLPMTHYIRAEVIRRVWKHLNHPPRAGDQIRIEGELHWDGHGFLEIHPVRYSDVRFLPASPQSPASKHPIKWSYSSTKSFNHTAQI
jgi:hypothetical protein